MQLKVIFISYSCYLLSVEDMLTCFVQFNCF